MAEDLIVIDRLVKKYGDVVALADVSLTIRRGEFLSMLGPSGCGKTTLLRAIAGLVKPDGGSIRIGGIAMTDVPPNRRPVNTVFQNYALFPHMTVAENIAFGPKRRGMKRAEIAGRTDEVLAMVGMQDYGARYPQALSGGQQQRIALARAIINQPQVLLLDEPLGALDLKLRKRMQVELKRLHERLGITFIYVTHDQEEALSMSDRIAVMNQGEIVQLGTGTEIYHNPVSRYVADFIGEANLIAGVADADCNLCLAAGGTPLPYKAAAPGQTTLMVRPEDIRVGNSADRDAPILRGTIKHRAFIGQTWRFFVLLETGQEITVQPSATAAIDLLGPGDAITLWWPLQRGRVLTQ